MVNASNAERNGIIRAFIVAGCWHVGWGLASAESRGVKLRES
jgi:hypothetical protein